MEIFKEFTFEAAHRLPMVAPDHKCARLHGHSFQVALHVRGRGGRAARLVHGLRRGRGRLQAVYAQLDHHYLNEVEGLENPTSENLARWIWERVAPALPGLCKVVVRETCTAGCVYEGPA